MYTYYIYYLFLSFSSAVLEQVLKKQNFSELTINFMGKKIVQLRKLFIAVNSGYSIIQRLGTAQIIKLDDDVGLNVLRCQGQ